MNKQILLIVIVMCASVLAKDKFNYKDKDMMRKSIVFDKNTPDVFYCPTHKPTGLNKLIVRSRPLHKLCEYEGKQLPEDYKSDCYQDIDESDYACKEKYRIMKRFAKKQEEMRLYPPGSDAPYNGTRLVKFMKIDKNLKLLMAKN